MIDVRYGKIETVTVEGDTSVSTEETIYNYTTTKRIQRFSQNVIGERKKDVIAEALKLIDRLSDEDVLTIGYDCVKKDKGVKFKMVVSWTVKA